MTEAKTCPTCGAPLPADATGGACPKCLLQAGFATGTGGAAATSERVPTPEELAPKFPGLEIGALLGRGGMGVVYRARHKALDRDVALKILPASFAADRAFADRFQREARALAKLQHPNIVAVYDFGQSVDENGGGLFWLVMEFVDGANIRQAMRAGQVHPKEALAIVPQICDALQYAHEHGVVHRDIKPENVLLDKSGRVKVADFGLAKLMEHDAAAATLTGAGQVMGTPHYMAPEQWEHPKDVDHRADIYSLGVVFYEMLTGELPVGRFAAPSKKSDVDARIDEIVLRTLEREREARYQHVSQVKTDVGHVATSPPPAFAAPAPAPHRGGAAWLAAAGVVGCAVAVLLITSNGSSDIVRTVASVGGIVTGALLIGHVWSRRRHRTSDAQRPRWGWWIVLASLLFCGGPLALVSVVLTGAPAKPRVIKPETVSSGVSADDLRGIQAKWRRLQETDFSAGPASVISIYADEDRGALMAIAETDRLLRGGRGELGMPLLATGALARAIGELEIVGVTALSADAMTAEVTATDGVRRLRFPMRRSADGRVWDFAIGPVEVE